MTLWEFQPIPTLRKTSQRPSTPYHQLLEGQHSRYLFQLTVIKYRKPNHNSIPFQQEAARVVITQNPQRIGFPLLEGGNVRQQLRMNV